MQRSHRKNNHYLELRDGKIKIFHSHHRILIDSKKSLIINKSKPLTGSKFNL